MAQQQQINPQQRSGERVTALGPTVSRISPLQYNKNLENKVVQLENQLKAVSLRAKKDLIWKKTLEDFVLKTFNFDLRLQVEMKLLENDCSDTSTYSPIDNNSSQIRPQSVPRLIGVRTSSINAIKNAYIRGAGAQTTGLKSTAMPLSRKRAHNISYPRVQQNDESMTCSIPPSIILTTVPKNPTNRNHLGQISPSSTSRFTAGSANNNSNAPPRETTRTRTGNNEPSKKIPCPYPTSAVQENIQTENTTTSIIVSTSSAPACDKSKTQRSPEIILLDSDSDSRHSVEQVSISNEGSRNSTTSTRGNNSNSTNLRTQSTTSFIPNTVSENPQTFFQNSQDLLAYIDQYTHAITASPDSSNNPGYSGSGTITPPQMLSYRDKEQPYIVNNYLTRKQERLSYNIQKILIDSNSLPADFTRDIEKYGTTVLPQALKKQIASSVCEFLIQIYGENVPRETKDAMAQSLHEVFKSTSKESWYNKNINRNATGLIENKLIAIRKQLKEQRNVSQIDNLSLFL